MITIDLPQEVAASCLEMAIALSMLAHEDVRLTRTASFVHRCYVRAVTSTPNQHTHELRWRRFINALDAYLDRCSNAAPALAHRMRELVSENGDLLDGREAMAS
ncbi:MAG TPA: hypothetical protein VKT72_03535 [Candidatus Baltobacteraceae bacterium]|nr:hypothetical protein [Candidatus Baltobacteraceae bacterium]